MGNVYVSEIHGKAHWGLTQKGMTALCDVCGGVGAVLAYPVSDTLDRDSTYADKYPLARSLDAEVGSESVLIPCPGCFNHEGIQRV